MVTSTANPNVTSSRLKGTPPSSSFSRVMLMVFDIEAFPESSSTVRTTVYSPFFTYENSGSARFEVFPSPKSQEYVYVPFPTTPPTTALKNRMRAGADPWVMLEEIEARRTSPPPPPASVTRIRKGCDSAFSFSLPFPFSFSLPLPSPSSPDPPPSPPDALAEESSTVSTIS